MEAVPTLLLDAPRISKVGSRLRVTVLEAKGLRAADVSVMGRLIGGGGTSDPYCCCEVLGKPDTKFQTKHISKTLEPQWNEEHEIEDYEQGDPLEFTVFDYDEGSNDLLGKATLGSSHFDREGGFEGNLGLRESAAKVAATLLVKVEVLPPLLPEAPRISVHGSRLLVTVFRAKGLRAADINVMGKLRGGRGTSDPYCCCEVLGKPDTKFQTTHINKTLEPEWNEEHEIDDYEPGCPLEFRVFDHDQGSGDDLLGRVTLFSNYFDREGGFEGELRLRESGTQGPAAKLFVRVEVLPPLLPEAPRVSEVGSRLRVTVLAAKGLRAADFNLINKLNGGGGTSDPYCVCEVPGKPDSKLQTRHLSKTCDPEWNEEHDIEDYEQGDPLEFKVFDHDRGDDLLGKVTLPGTYFDRDGGFSGELRLRESAKTGPAATLSLRVEVLPPLIPDAPPVSESGSRLRVTVLGAKGLRAADWNILGAATGVRGTSDPYCRFGVPGKPESKVQTQHITKTLDPEWNEEHEIEEWEQGDPLEFTVLDHGRGSGDDLLGRYLLPGNLFDREGGFEGEVRLRGCGNGPAAKLTLNVQVLPPLLPYDPPISRLGSRLKIAVLGAKGLRAADFNNLGRLAGGGGTSHPYCCCEVPGNPDSKVQTETTSKTLNPEWNEEFEIEDYEKGDPLEFSIYDYDMSSADVFLGRVTLVGNYFDREGGFEGELRLKEAGTKRGPAAKLHVKVEVLPPLWPEAEPIWCPGGRLIVQILGAKNLRAAYFNVMGKLRGEGGTLDSYCRCEVPEKPETKVQTQCISKTLEPMWNEEFEVAEYEQGDPLEFNVFDYCKSSADDFLGRATLLSHYFDREGGFEADLNLKCCGTRGALATLAVRVVIIVPEADPAEEERRKAEMGLWLSSPRQAEVQEVEGVLEREPLKRGEVIVRMQYSSVQPLDTHIWKGEAKGGLPRGLGFEGVGMVTMSRDDEMSEGTRVAFMLRDYVADASCWRTQVRLSHQRACIARLPQGLVPQEAAAAITSTLTAIACLRHFSPGCHVSENAGGAVVVVTGACGAVGLALCQLAALRGMRTVALVRGGFRAAWLEKELGKAHRGRISAVDITSTGWLALAAALCACSDEGGGADGVIDGVGGPALVDIARRLLRPRGKVVRYGVAGGQEADAAAMGAASRELNLALVNESAASTLALHDASAHLSDALTHMAAGRLHGFIWQSVNWRNAAFCLQPQPSWSPYPTQVDEWRPWDERRIGRILLKFD